jgi:hypothetical protein
LAQGNVLEICVGSGVNFIHYDLARVDRVYALEPNPGMLRRAEEQRRRTELDPEFSRSSRRTHSLGKRERRYSTGRVLKPGGKLIFFEHGLSPDPRVRRWQERLEPLFRWAFEGCHVTCDIPSLIGEGGFNIEQTDAGYLAPFPKSPSYC